MFADVPTQGVRTLYAQFGDWLGWLSAGLVLAFGVVAIYLSLLERGRKGDQQPETS